MTLENWGCYEQKHAKNLGGYLGPLKTDFEDLKGKYCHSPIYSFTFGGKIPNLNWSFHGYQINAPLSVVYHP